MKLVPINYKFCKVFYHITRMYIQVGFPKGPCSCYYLCLCLCPCP